MDSRIVEVTESMARKSFRLPTDYEVKTCNIKATTVEMVMHNGLVEIKVKFPRALIEDAIEALDEEE